MKKHQKPGEQKRDSHKIGHLQQVVILKIALMKKIEVFCLMQLSY